MRINELIEPVQLGLWDEHLNSSGKPIHPSERGVKNFLRWFGSSKVVDRNNRPLVVYHGTALDLLGGAFNPDMAKSEGGAFYFSHSPLMKNTAHNANDYAGGRSGGSPNVIPVYLKMVSPLVAGFSEPMPDAEVGPWLDKVGKFNRSLDNSKEKYYARMIRDARRGGHDGVIFRNVEDVANDAGRRFVDETDVYVVFEPTQIKSAVGNNGNFNPTDPRITEDNNE